MYNKHLLKVFGESDLSAQAMARSKAIVQIREGKKRKYGKKT